MLALQQAQANLINGSIGFSGVATVDSGEDLAVATQFTSIDAVVSTVSGSYGVIPTSIFLPTVYLTLGGTTTGGSSMASPGLMRTHTFNPAQGAVTPLWSFDYAGVNYSFDATSMTATYNATAEMWNISGQGLADITGYQTTPGSWNANVGAQGGSFFFGSAVTVPDGGLTVALLGVALVTLQVFRRKLLC